MYRFYIQSLLFVSVKLPIKTFPLIHCKKQPIFNSNICCFRVVSLTFAGTQRVNSRTRLSSLATRRPDGHKSFVEEVRADRSAK